MDRGEQKKRANKLEKELAKYLGGSRVPASGALSGWKGDVEWGEYLVDSKNTVTKIITVSATDLIKITREARQAGKEQGHLILSFLSGKVGDEHWALVPYYSVDFESLEFSIQVAKTKQLSYSMLKNLERRSLKGKIMPSVLFSFERMPLGTCNKWLLIRLEDYRELYND
jgi:hypothetical protein